MMWRSLKRITKEWIRKHYQLTATSRSVTSEINNYRHDHEGDCSTNVATSSFEPPCFYVGEEHCDADAESCLTRIQDSSGCDKVIHPNRKFKRGQRSSCGFFDCLGYGYFVAAGLRLSRYSHFSSDAHDDKKDNQPRWSVLKDALLVLAFGGRTSFSRHRLSVLPIASTVQSSSASKVQKADQNTDTSYPWLEPHLNQLSELGNQYTAIALNSQALWFIEENDYSQAIEFLAEASRLGLDLAMFNLGVCHERGYGVEPDLAKACECYRQAAELGHPTAVYNLAVNLLEGRGVPVNKDEGLKWMEIASNSGVKEAQTYWGLRCGQNGDYEKAFSLFQMAATQEHADGEYFLGFCYENGLGVKMDEQKAACLYEKSAGAGNADACYALASFYEKGLGGLKQCNNTAMKLYEKAASGGHTLATKKLECNLQDEDADESNLKTTKATTITTRKPAGLRAVSSSPELSRYRKDNILTPRIDYSSSMFDVTGLKEALLDYLKIDLKSFTGDHDEIDGAKENCRLLSNETLKCQNDNNIISPC